MGEIADGLINGDFDEETGEYIGEGMGFPRSPSRDARERREKQKSKGPTTGDNAVRGVTNYIVKRGLDKDDLDTVLTKCLREHIKSKGMFDRIVICNIIQEDFGAFVKWFKTNYGQKK